MTEPRCGTCDRWKLIDGCEITGWCTPPQPLPFWVPMDDYMTGTNEGTNCPAHKPKDATKPMDDLPMAPDNDPGIPLARAWNAHADRHSARRFLAEIDAVRRVAPADTIPDAAVDAAYCSFEAALAGTVRDRIRNALAAALPHLAPRPAVAEPIPDAWIEGDAAAMLREVFFPGFSRPHQFWEDRIRDAARRIDERIAAGPVKSTADEAQRPCWSCPPETETGPEVFRCDECPRRTRSHHRVPESKTEPEAPVFTKEMAILLERLGLLCADGRRLSKDGARALTEAAFPGPSTLPAPEPPSQCICTMPCERRCAYPNGLGMTRCPHAGWVR